MNEWLGVRYKQVWPNKDLFVLRGGTGIKVTHLVHEECFLLTLVYDVMMNTRDEYTVRVNININKDVPRGNLKLHVGLLYEIVELQCHANNERHAL